MKKAKEEISKPKAICILSGGMDSTTLLYDVIDQGYEVTALSFDYNQKHKIELQSAKKTCKKLKIPHKIIKLSVLNDLAPSALTRKDWKVPQEHYEAVNQKQTVVNNRNPIMSNLALSYALTIGAEKIYLGIHAGDFRVYEDCRKPSLDALNETAYMWSSDERGELTPVWVASFFEGEGCFSHNNYRQIQYHRKTRKRLGVSEAKKIPRVIFSQKEKFILEEIQKFFYGRGTISFHKNSTGGCHQYGLQHQDCRLVIDLFKTYGFHTKHKEEQFKKWYKQFHEMFEREVECDNPKIRGKSYSIQKIKFEAPYLLKSKGDIVARGLTLKVDYNLTHTCYEGKETPCGKCGSCRERSEAFMQNDQQDPIYSNEEWEKAKKLTKAKGA